MKILKNLIPALKPGARIIINDQCLRDAGSENPWDEKLMRGMDMVMLTLLNAQEREEFEFRELFKAADERFAFKVSCLHSAHACSCTDHYLQGVTRIEGFRMSLVEAVWEPETEAAENGKPIEANGH